MRIARQLMPKKFFNLKADRKTSMKTRNSGFTDGN
jgi:hypothetical protein